MSLHIDISIESQTLLLVSSEKKIIVTYSISTSKYGIGEQNGSFCTPTGQHIVRAKIGKNQPINTIFIGRRPTGETFTEELKVSHPERDWILTRMMWLSGCELGINRLGSVDTMRRYIYLHGSPDSVVMGSPGSIGCIRMRNVDILELFDLVPVGTLVSIT